MHERTIPVRPVSAETPDPQASAYEAPYRWFLATSLALAIGGGFMLAVLLPLARAEGWA